MKNDRNNLKKLTVETLITLGFVAVSLLSLKYLGQPLAGIITGVLILLLALREYQNYKKLQTKPKDKSAEESEPDTNTETEDAEFMLQAFPSDRIYRVTRETGRYALKYEGNEAMGVGRDNPEKDRTIAFSDVSAVSLNMRRSVSTQLPSCGIIAFTAAGKKEKYIILGEHTQRGVLDFFADVRSRISVNEKTQQRNGTRQERKAEFTGWLADSRDEEKLPGKKKFAAALTVIGAISFVGVMFFPGPYILWVGLCMLVCMVSLLLWIIQPQYYSMLTTGTEAKKSYGRDIASVLLPFLLCTAGLALRTALDFNFLSDGKLLAYSAAAAAVLTAILYLTIREMRVSAASVVIILFLFGFFYGGLGEVDYILDMADPQVVQTQLVSKHVSTSSNSPDDYIFTIDLPGAEGFELSVAKEVYEQYGEGDAVPVGIYPGAVGIPYAEYIYPAQ